MADMMQDISGSASWQALSPGHPSSVAARSEWEELSATSDAMPKPSTLTAEAVVLLHPRDLPLECPTEAASSVKTDGFCWVSDRWSAEDTASEAESLQDTHSRASSTYKLDQHALQQQPDLLQQIIDVTAVARLSSSSPAPAEAPQLPEGGERRSATTAGLAPAGGAGGPSQSLSRLIHCYTGQLAGEDAVLRAFDKLWHGELGLSS